ncbi:hypothetical protein E2320_022266, partial [Naja naja]
MAGLPRLLLLLLLFWLLPPTIAKKTQTICVPQKGLNFQNQWEYYRPGDLIIGGNLPLAAPMMSIPPDFQNDPFLLINEFLRVYPSFFRTNPKEFPQYEGLVQLLLYFRWNWVGLVTSDDDNGEHFISSLMPMLKEKEICLAFTEMMKSDFYAIPGKKLLHISNIWPQGEVIILFGDIGTIAIVQVVVFAYETRRNTSILKVWIFTSNWKLNVPKSQYVLKVIKPFHGALHFRDHTRDVSEFSHVLLSLDPLNPQGDVFLPL